jgi:Calx-beta domain
MQVGLSGIGAAALMTGPLVGVATAAPTPIYVNASVTSTDPNCVAAANATIQSAVNAADDGDTIVVCPGTYAENVNDTGKVLTFRSQTPNGATVDGGGGTAFTLTGVGSSLDGFMLTGATDAADTPAASLQGNNEKVTDSTFDGDSNGATITLNGATLQGNIVQNPNSAFNDGAGAAGFFFNTGGGSNSTVTGNRFVGNFGDSAINVADPESVATNLTIDGNTADTTAGGNFVVAGGTKGLIVSNNTVLGGSASGTGILLLGGDSDYSITRNVISGRTKASAVSITDGYGYDENGGGDVSQNSFKGNLRGINVTAASGTITAHLNILVGNSEAAIKNTTNAVVSATNNFYGCNTGPGTTGCDDIGGNVNDTPYLVLSTTVAKSSIPQNGTTTFTADLNHNNAGNLVTGHVLDGAERAAFSFSGGTANPTTVPIIGGTATTVLTAGSKSGTFPATATVEDASSSKSVTITGSSTGGGKPTVKIIDANTAEGNSGTHAISFPVRLSKAATAPVTMHFQTADGSAKAGSDYVAKSGTLTIAKGAKAGTITVLVKGDKVKEASETFFVTLSNATNATIADPNASGVVKNDD